MYSEIGLRPRVMVNVKDVDTTTEMLGVKMSLPFFCAPAAMARMVHESGGMYFFYILSNTSDGRVWIEMKWKLLLSLMTAILSLVNFC